MIIVRIIGGLGNQMFQFSFGQYLESKGFKVKYDTSDFENYALHIYKLEQVFNIKLDVSSYSEFHKIKDNSSRIIPKARRVLFGSKSNYISEANFDLEKLDANKDCYLNGYWADWELVSEVNTTIKRKFEITHNLSDKINKILLNINKTNSVSIHFRRGDYINNPNTFNYHGVCDIEYYQNAVELISNKITDPCFFVFSDDIPWVKSNFQIKKYPVTFIENTKDYEDLKLMSNCKHNIIANSTFSWWGAWLNSNIEKIVIAPKQWYRNIERNNTINILPDHWIKI